MRLLLVEDNERLAQLVIDGLNKAGFDVDARITASEARESLKTTRYAAIILDLGLPDEDGRHILRELRRRGDPTPIVILTARSLQDLHQALIG
jgi:DNA-binding response OmpR family regulator